MKIFLPGGAGLVGLNLIHQIKNNYPNWELIVVDKKSKSIDIAKKLFTDSNISFICEDLNNINKLKSDIQENLSNNCGPWAIARQIYLCLSLPKTKSGKILRRFLKLYVKDKYEINYDDYPTAVSKNLLINFKAEIL